MANSFPLSEVIVLIKGFQFCNNSIVNVVVKTLDSAVAFTNSGGEIMQYFGVGNVEADYYFNFVVKAGLNIDIPISTYHTIDGFTDGSIEIYSPIEVGLEAGGSIRVEVFDLYGEAMIHASAKAKFKIIYKGATQSNNLIFSFEGIEATVKAKIIGSKAEDGEDDKVKPENVKEKDVKIFDGFNVEIPFFEYKS